MILLDGKNLGLQLDERKLFQSMNLEVKPGDFWVLHGPSGVGKSSFLRLLSGELRPSEGAVIRSSPCSEIPQDLGLNLELTVLQNAMLGWYRGKSLWSSLQGPSKTEIETQKQALLEWGLTSFHQPTGELSGGEKQRLSFVRSLLENWKVLLADEPISSLDPEMADRLLAHLKAVAIQRGAGVVAVLHQPKLIEKYATHEIDFGQGVPNV